MGSVAQSGSAFLYLKGPSALFSHQAVKDFVLVCSVFFNLFKLKKKKD